ncbi:MAG: hypothetical protein ACRDLE_04965 [Gaiellaceae bacterium]
MNTYAFRRLGRVADAAGIGTEELRDLIETIVDERLGLVAAPVSDTPRITGCREVYGEGHATVSYIADPEGTDIVPPGYEPPPGYHGPQRY